MSDEISASRLESLPKWAQAHIQNLRRERDHLKELTEHDDQLVTGTEIPGLHIGYGINRELHRVIPMKEVHGSRLVLGDGQQFTFYMQEPGVMGLNHIDDYGRRLLIMPNAANTIDLSAQPRKGQS